MKIIAFICNCDASHRRVHVTGYGVARKYRCRIICFGHSRPTHCRPYSICSVDNTEMVDKCRYHK